MAKNSLPILFVFLFASTNLFGQIAKAYAFIEPTSSISYDSNLFRITRFTNNSFATESYHFSCIGDSSKEVDIFVKSDHPIKYPPIRERDSLVMATVEEIRNTQNDTFEIISVDKQIR